jgi:hypothetical protein
MKSQEVFANWWKNIGKQMADKTKVKEKNICNICRKVFTKGYKGEEWEMTEKESLNSDLNFVVKEAYKIGVKTHIISLIRKIDGVFVSFT